MAPRPDPSSGEWEGHWFDPVAFTERWLETEWEKHRPREYNTYLDWVLRKEADAEDS